MIKYDRVKLSMHRIIVDIRVTGRVCGVSFTISRNKYKWHLSLGSPKRTE